MPGSSATPVPGTIFLTSNSGDHLVRSTNWGRTWRVVLDHPVSQFVFMNRTTGLALVRDGTSQTTYSLFRTIDAGSRWKKVNE
jgi:hypothetical protein